MVEVERATSAMWHCPCPVDYGDWFKLLCAIRDADVPKDEARRWCESGEGFDAAVFESKWERGIKESGAVKAASLFAAAFAHGWQDSATSRARRVDGSRPKHPTAKTTKAQPAPAIEAESAKAARVWARCIPATRAEPYIFTKGGTPEGLRVYPASAPPLIIGKGDDRITAAGGLVVPCYAPDGETVLTIQIIPLVGKKMNLPGAQFGNGYFTVGQVTDRIYIVEGIGQAWACNRVTGAAAVVCFGAGRMATVAKVLREKYPDALLVMVPDRGKENQAAAIAADVAGQWCELPADKPGNYDVNDYAAEHGTAALAALLECVKVPAMRFTLLSGADLANAKPMRWLVRGVLPAEGLAALFGASGSGKSFLILDIGGAVAGGDYQWFGRRVTQAPVTYVCLEGEAGMGKRITAWRLHHNKPVPDALRFITQAFDILSDDVPELAKAVIAGGGAGGLVILDTLNRAAPGADENSSVDMGNIIAAAKKLQSLTGGLVLAVHHAGKDQTKGLRGHSSLHAALDGAIEVTKTDTRHEWSIAKSKDDVTGEARPFKLQIVPVGIDDDGEEITSCVIVSDESIGNAMRRALPPKSGNQKIIWDALGAVLRESGQSGQAGAPAGRPCIRLEDAVEKTRGRLVCDAKRQTERAQSAIGGLVARGLLEHREGWLWVA